MACPIVVPCSVYGHTCARCIKILSTRSYVCVCWSGQVLVVHRLQRPTASATRGCCRSTTSTAAPPSSAASSRVGEQAGLPRGRRVTGNEQKERARRRRKKKCHEILTFLAFPTHFFFFFFALHWQTCSTSDFSLCNVATLASLQLVNNHHVPNITGNTQVHFLKKKKNLWWCIPFFPPDCTRPFMVGVVTAAAAGASRGCIGARARPTTRRAETV